MRLTCESGTNTLAINHIVIFQPLYIVAELLPWLVTYFDPLFQALKRHLKVQERIFAVMVPRILSLCKTGA